MVPGARTRLYGLLGHPIAHSLSPLIHNAAFAAAGVDAVYLALPVPPADLAAAVGGARALRVGGLNVTVPHKVAVLSLLDALEPEAEEVGAANTLLWQGDRLVGTNTDVAGFLAGLGGAAVDRAVVLGAGGASRAVGVALARRGASEVTFAVRRPGGAQEVIDHLARHHPHVRWGERAWRTPDGQLPPELLAGVDLLVNATPLGTPLEAEGGRVQGCPLPGTPAGIAEDLDRLAPGATVYDLIYATEGTPLLDAARASGRRAVGGLPMLVAQAGEAFTRWTGRPFPGAAVEAELGRVLGVETR